jgi:GNAT superfamily N-acetyltransferase
MMSMKMSDGMQMAGKANAQGEKVALKVFDSSNFEEFATNPKMSTARRQIGEIYQKAYENSEFWPLYKEGDIGPVWGRELAKFAAKNGILIVAQDRDTGEVLGSIMAVPFAKVMDSHSDELKLTISRLREVFGEEKLRQMHFGIDITVSEAAQRSGVGMKIMNRYIEEIGRRGFTAMLDWTSPVDGNPVISSFYRKLGIEEIPGRMRGIEWSASNKVATINGGKQTESTSADFHFEGEENAIYGIKWLDKQNKDATALTAAARQ